MSQPRQSTRLALRLLLRDWKAGELTVLATALLVAVSALTAVAFLTDRVGQAVERRAAEALAADLRLASAQVISDQYEITAADFGLETARTASMPSVVFVASGDDSGANTLAGIRAVSERYPLRGQLKTSAKLLAEATVSDHVPARGEAWASPRLLARLGTDTGVTLEVGRVQLKLTRVLEHRPDEGFRFADLAPTLLINYEDLEATGLVQPGSRVSWRMLFAGDRAAVESFKQQLSETLASGEGLEDIKDTNPQIRSAMERSGRFLNLSSLISVLLAAVAVAMAARRYAHRHRDRIALMKCMGASQAYVLRSSLLQLLMLALGGALLGSLVGYFAQHGLSWMMRDLIGEVLPAPGPQPVLVGLVTAISILAGFALPDLWQMSRTPPLRVLRHDLDPPPLRYGIPWVAAIASLILLLLWLVRDTRLVLTILAGTGVTFLALGCAGWLLVRVLSRFRGAGGAAWRYGLASLARRGRESIVQLVAFGLGLMVLLLLTIVRTELLDSWRQSLPDGAPNQFLINIQTHETEALQDFLRQRGVDAPELVPLVRARMTHINGKDVTQMSFEDPQGEEWAKRDSNLTWRASLQEDNKIVEGQIWGDSPEQNEVSVEAEFASELGLKLTDEVSFDIAGESVSAIVTSIRSVEWDSFRPNFFMLFSPGTLDGFPTSWISSLYLPEGKNHVVLELMRKFPSVTAVDLEATLAQVRDVMDKAALAVQAVFLFTLLAGITVLWAAVQSSRDERRFESALLRTFGASRQRVLTGVAVEFMSIGLLSGVLAASGASLAGYLLATRLFELEYQFSPGLWLAGPIAGMLLVGLSGLVATWRVITHAPVNVLRTA